MTEHDVLYLRGKASKVFQEGERVTVWGVDTLTGLPVEVEADLVVLATATVPRADSRELGRRLRVSTDEHGFFSEAHPKLRPVESLTAGIFLARRGPVPQGHPGDRGPGQWGGGQALRLFSQSQMVQEPTIAYVDTELCSGCGLCIPACPTRRARCDEWRNVAVVNTALCQGAVAPCTMVCPNKACQLRQPDARQVLTMMEAYL